MPVGAKSKEISSLKRELKRAKLFEVQRHVRRIKQLANKKGTDAQIKKNQRKVERFVKELEFLKDADVNDIALSIATKGREYEHQNMVGDDHGEVLHQLDTDLKKRALGRIINSAKVQKFLQRSEANSKDFVASANNDGKKQKTVAKEKVKTKALDNTVSVKPRPKESAEGRDSHTRVPRIEGKQKSADLKLMATTTASGEPEMKKIDVYVSSSEEDQSKLEEEKLELELSLNESDEGDDFLASSDLSGNDFATDNDDESSPGLKHKGLESCFVQAMSGMNSGKGSNRRHKKGEDRGKPGDRKGKKNRMGQRARQKMWEKMHGKSAKHLQKNKQGINVKGNKEPRKQISRFKPQQSFEPASADKPLHPSWEAMRKKRSQETLKVEFKGKRIKFDDSE